MMGSAELGAIVLTIALIAVRLHFTRTTVFEYEKGLKYQNGRFKQILEPGRHWVYTPTTVVRNIDIRPRFVAIPGQEVLSSDGVTLKVSVAARYEVAQPDRAVNQSEDYVAALYLILQLALREVMGQSRIDEILEIRGQLSERLFELTRGPVEKLGLNLLSINLRDIMFPGELKKMFAQVTQARQEGLAALERARGETAALRNLANAAKLVDDNPSLLHLRLLQQLGESGGNSVVLGFPPFAGPVPINTDDKGSQVGSPKAPQGD